MMLHVGHHRKRARTALAAEPMPNLSLPASPLSPDAGDPYLPGSAGTSECKSHELPALLPGMKPSYKPSHVDVPALGQTCKAHYCLPGRGTTWGQ